jgi:hypothetical protein
MFAAIETVKHRSSRLQHMDAAREPFMKPWAVGGRADWPLRAFPSGAASAKSSSHRNAVPFCPLANQCSRIGSGGGSVGLSSAVASVRCPCLAFSDLYLERRR